MTVTAEQTKLRISEVFKHVRYAPHPAQALFHRSSARNRVAACGRRFGKSEMGAGELDIEAVRTRYMLSYLEDLGIRREFWIVGPNYTDSEKEFRKHYNAMKRVDAPFDKPGTYYDPHAGDMQISMYGGKYMVIGKSAMHEERLVGEGLSGVIMAEAAKQKERTWTKYIRPTLADFNGWSIHSSTPEGKNWFYDLWKRGQDPNELEWDSWRFGSWRNPIVFPKGATPAGLAMLREVIDDPTRPLTPRIRKASGVDNEIIEMMLDLTAETFNQEVAADFTEFTGRVFKGFDEEVHVGDFPFESNRRTYAAVDYGFTDPFVWLLIQEDMYGNVFVLDELYQSYLSIDDAARLVDARNLASGVIEFYPDPASPGDTLALERHLKIRANPATGGELNIRLRYIREALKIPGHLQHLEEDDPLRRPRLQIDRKCVNLIREMQDYRYPDRTKDQKGKDQPLDKDNHAPEALGRFYRGRYGDPGASTTGGGARVASSNLSRGRRGH